MTIKDLEKTVKKYAFRGLYVLGFCLVTSTIWITKNQIRIDELQDKVKEQSAIIEHDTLLINNHEWLVLNHDKRIDLLEIKKK